MYLIHKPEGGDERRWEYVPGRLRVMEMEAIERATGLAYGEEFKQKLLMGATAARRALLWTFLRREHPTIKYADVDFYDDELTLVQDKGEIERSIAELANVADAMPAEDRAAAEAYLRAQLADAPEPPGTAPAATSEIATG